jgi:hypothetical protein
MIVVESMIRAFSEMLTEAWKVFDLVFIDIYLVALMGSVLIIVEYEVFKLCYNLIKKKFGDIKNKNKSGQNEKFSRENTENPDKIEVQI